jgi:hypothetical protein
MCVEANRRHLASNAGDKFALVFELKGESRKVFV